MKKKISKYLLIGCAMLLCSLVTHVPQTQAVTYSSADNLGLVISDTNTNQLVSHPLTIPDDIVIGDISVTLDLEHTWVGDLEIILNHPDGDYLFLVLPEGDPDDNENEFALGREYTFTDSTTAELPRTDDPRIVDGYIIPHGDYLPIAATLSPEDIKHSNFFDKFSGKNAKGGWLLEIYDHGVDDNGTLQSWQLNIGSEEPGCLDAAVLATTYGLTSADAGFNRACDFDKDNDIDGSDLAEMM